MSLCDKIQLPDDVTIGYVAGELTLLKTNEEFNRDYHLLFIPVLPIYYIRYSE